jgi:hypothetical protein
MKTILLSFAALLTGQALLGAATSANALPVTAVPDARWNAAICAGVSQICNPQLAFPANTQASFSHSTGSSSVSASYSLTPTPSLSANGSASGDANAQAFLDYQYFIEVTGSSGTVPLTVNTTGSATGGATATVLLQNNTTFFQPYSVFTSNGSTFVSNNGVSQSFSGTSFNRSDVVSIAANQVYEVAVALQLYASASNPSETGSVDPYFQVPNGYSLLISSGVGNFPATATPLPGTLPLFVSGLGIIGFLAKSRKGSKRVLAAA